MNAEVLEKIRKLLRLSKSSNPHEAALAMARAAEIARKHHIEISEVGTGQERPSVTEEKFEKPSRLSEIRKRAMVMCQDFFNVTIIYGTVTMTFVGRPEDIAVAKYVYDYLVRACTAAVIKFKPRDSKQRFGFVRGFYFGVRESLEINRKEETAHGMAVILRSQAERENFCQKQHPDVKSTSCASKQAHDAYAAFVGMEQGRKVSIRPGLQGGFSERRELQEVAA